MEFYQVGGGGTNEVSVYSGYSGLTLFFFSRKVPYLAEVISITTNRWLNQLLVQSLNCSYPALYIAIAHWRDNGSTPGSSYGFNPNTGWIGRVQDFKGLTSHQCYLALSMPVSFGAYFGRFIHDLRELQNIPRL